MLNYLTRNLHIKALSLALNFTGEFFINPHRVFFPPSFLFPRSVCLQHCWGFTTSHNFNRLFLDPASSHSRLQTSNFALLPLYLFPAASIDSYCTIFSTEAMFAPKSILAILVFAVRLTLVHANGRNRPSISSTTTTMEGRFWTTVLASKTIIQGVDIPVAHTRGPSIQTTSTHTPTTLIKVTTSSSTEVTSSSLTASDYTTFSPESSDSEPYSIPSTSNSAPTAPASSGVLDVPDVDKIRSLPPWKLGMIIGLVVLFVLLIAFVTIFCCWQRKSRQLSEAAGPGQSSHMPPTPSMAPHQSLHDPTIIRRPARIYSPDPTTLGRTRVVEENTRAPEQHFDIRAESTLNSLGESTTSISSLLSPPVSMQHISSGTLPSGRSSRESMMEDGAVTNTSSSSSSQADSFSSDPSNKIEMVEKAAKKRWTIFETGELSSR